MKRLQEWREEKKKQRQLEEKRIIEMEQIGKLHKAAQDDWKDAAKYLCEQWGGKEQGSALEGEGENALHQ